MSAACDADVCGRWLLKSDSSNKPFEWTGHHQPSAVPPHAPCLPLKASVQIHMNSFGHTSAILVQRL